MAMGSASEVQYDLLLAHDLGFLSSTVFQQLDTNVIEVKRMLATLIKKLRADS
jgi:four helix bundle protein